VELLPIPLIAKGLYLLHQVLQVSHASAPSAELIAKRLEVQMRKERSWTKSEEKDAALESEDPGAHKRDRTRQASADPNRSTPLARGTEGSR
jgi:hypothetical protein